MAQDEFFVLQQRSPALTIHPWCSQAQHPGLHRRGHFLCRKITDGSFPRWCQGGEFCCWGLLIPSFPFLQNTLVSPQRICQSDVICDLSSHAQIKPQFLQESFSTWVPLCSVRRSGMQRDLGLMLLLTKKTIINTKPYPQHRTKNSIINSEVEGKGSFYLLIAWENF